MAQAHLDGGTRPTITKAQAARIQQLLGQTPKAGDATGSFLKGLQSGATLAGVEAGVGALPTGAQGKAGTAAVYGMSPQTAGETQPGTGPTSASGYYSGMVAGYAGAKYTASQLAKMGVTQGSATGKTLATLSLMATLGMGTPGSSSGTKVATQYVTQQAGGGAGSSTASALGKVNPPSVTHYTPQVVTDVEKTVAKKMGWGVLGDVAKGAATLGEKVLGTPLQLLLSSEVAGGGMEATEEAKMAQQYASQKGTGVEAPVTKVAPTQTLQGGSTTQTKAQSQHQVDTAPQAPSSAGIDTHVGIQTATGTHTVSHTTTTPVTKTIQEHITLPTAHLEGGKIVFTGGDKTLTEQVLGVQNYNPDVGAGLEGMTFPQYQAPESHLQITNKGLTTHLTSGGGTASTREQMEEVYKAQQQQKQFEAQHASEIAATQRAQGLIDVNKGLQPGQSFSSHEPMTFYNGKLYYNKDIQPWLDAQHKQYASEQARAKSQQALVDTLNAQLGKGVTGTRTVTTQQKVTTQKEVPNVLTPEQVKNNEGIQKLRAYWTSPQAMETEQARARATQGVVTPTVTRPTLTPEQQAQALASKHLFDMAAAQMDADIKARANPGTASYSMEYAHQLADQQAKQNPGYATYQGTQAERTQTNLNFNTARSESKLNWARAQQLKQAQTEADREALSKVGTAERDQAYFGQNEIINEQVNQRSQEYAEQQSKQEQEHQIQNEQYGKEQLTKEQASKEEELSQMHEPRANTLLAIGALGQANSNNLPMATTTELPTSHLTTTAVPKLPRPVSHDHNVPKEKLSTPVRDATTTTMGVGVGGAHVNLFWDKVLSTNSKMKLALNLRRGVL